MEAQQKVSSGRNKSWIGKQLKVLVDGLSEESDLLLQGRSEFQGPDVDGLVYINDGTARPGTFNNVEITEAHTYDLIGRIVT
jgi:ribosomal protein S12 methylthiotransferase